MTADPFILPYRGVLPVVAPRLDAGPGAALIGRVTLGPRARLGSRAVLRGDGHVVEIGADFFLGEAGTVHIAHEIHPALVGDRVSVGRGGVVHACTIGADCVLEEGAIVLDGAVVGEGAVLEAGAIALPRSELAGGLLHAGIPARPVRPVTPGERAERAARLRGAPPGAVPRPTGPARLEIEPSTFIAGNAVVSGVVRGGARSAVLFSCVLDAGAFEIVVGERSNIQDNSTIRCVDGPFVMAADAVVGHNVTLENCTIGTGSLVGTGSHVAAGTVIAADVLLAAGARTQPGQVLTGGTLWGGNPARPLAPLDDRKRRMIPWIVTTYCQYTADFLVSQRVSQASPAPPERAEAAGRGPGWRGAGSTVRP
ncbi:gamma carbonic anhydrase family protein [Xanthobacter sp. V4C-4]|uniref:gamma carbonic anhydrase family protein n=1 Tax=Xanthobacter cornucopiae TaxID=3119924 RepID=UPI003729C85F